MRNSLTYELGPGFRRDDGILAKMEKNIVIPAKAGIHECAYRRGGASAMTVNITDASVAPPPAILAAGLRP
jgi:hypothetical protein